MDEEGLDLAEAGYYTLDENMHRVYLKVGNKKKAKVSAEIVAKNKRGLDWSREWKTGKRQNLDI